MIKKMKSIKLQILIFTFIIFSAVGTVAQDYTFKVMASSGVSKKGTTALKIGSTLLGADQVTVDAKSYLSLAHSKGGTVQISKAGTYKVAELEKQMLAAKKSVSQKYANFVIGEITKANGEDIHKNPYKYQNVTGSVERSWGSAMAVRLPKTTFIYKDAYTFSWYKPKDGKVFIYVLDEFSEIIKTYEKSGNDTTLTFNLKDFSESALYAVVVSTKPIAKEKLEKDGDVLKKGFGIRKMEAADLEKFKKELQALRTSLGGDEKDVNLKLNEAIFLEEKEMYLDAMQAYEEAIKLEPNDEVYKIAYNQFLIRKNIGLQIKPETSNE